MQICDKTERKLLPRGRQEPRVSKSARRLKYVASRLQINSLRSFCVRALVAALQPPPAAETRSGRKGSKNKRSSRGLSFTEHRLLMSSFSSSSAHGQICRSVWRNEPFGCEWRAAANTTARWFNPSRLTTAVSNALIQDAFIPVI